MNQPQPTQLGQLLLLAVEATHVNQEIQALIRKYQPSGFSLFRGLNVESPAQVRQFTTDLQAEALKHGVYPLIIAADQEGGQLMAVAPGVTPLPGNMALGAVGDETLAFQAGQVLGRELAAVGVNVNYAPCADVNINPLNPVIGTRSFGDDPQQVGLLAAAVTRGIQSAGVAATVKHFPGHGDTASDSHHGIPQVPHDLQRLSEVEIPPFQQTIKAGVQLVMSCHLALPAITARQDLPATLSKAVLTALLREQLGFQGVIVTDALDMAAIRQGEALGLEAVAAILAGADLLLTMLNHTDRERIFAALQQAYSRQILPETILQASLSRIQHLKTWIQTHYEQPHLSVVNSPEHQAVAAEIANRSVTLVRDPHHLLPIQPENGQHILVLMPQPIDLTPADTSSYETPSLKKWWADDLPGVEEIRYPMDLDFVQTQNLIERARQADIIIVGTINAFDQTAQQVLLQKLVELNKALIVTALRLPYDAGVLHQTTTVLCTYSVLPPSMRALADILIGKRPAEGRLPVKINE